MVVYNICYICMYCGIIYNMKHMYVIHNVYDVDWMWVLLVVMVDVCTMIDVCMVCH